jgi:hypothetical protein
MVNLFTELKHFDKFAHMLVGTVVTFAGNFVHAGVGPPATVAIARWKEVYDGKHPGKHTSDGWDAYATVCGIIPGELLFHSRFLILSLF